MKKSSINAKKLLTYGNKRYFLYLESSINADKNPKTSQMAGKSLIIIFITYFRVDSFNNKISELYYKK